MAAGLMTGLLIHEVFEPETAITQGVKLTLAIGGQLFMNALKMLVVPVVFVSLVCGMFSLKTGAKIASVARRTFLLYLSTTVIAISLALLIANLLGIGQSNHLIPKETFELKNIPGVMDVIVNLIPSNPVAALSEGNMLQIILLALLFGLACNRVGESAAPVKKVFIALQSIIMNLMELIIKFTPIGVFCLVATLFADTGIALIQGLASYFLTVLLVLFLQLFITYGCLVHFYARLSSYRFFRHMLAPMMFAFSTSSSAVSIPIVLQAVKEKMGVHSSIASFVIPLGATINMDGTAVMQGVATVFIANTYGIDLTLTAFLQIILISTLASIGTAAVPGVGLITLSMVLTQVGLPVEGIALIIGVDRLLDMARTSVNICGDATVACSVARKEDQLDIKRYMSR